MPYQPGESGNRMGRPKGSYGGRIKALASLDKMMAQKKHQTRLIRALEKEFVKNPVLFFRTMIMPLLPKESKLAFDHEGVIEWRSLLTVAAEGKPRVQGSGFRTDGERSIPAEFGGRKEPEGMGLPPASLEAQSPGDEG
jgi:hypothetical protein